MSLAIYALQLYEREFDLGTWKFIQKKLKDMKSWDQIDAVSTGVLGIILLKYPSLEKEVMKMARNKNLWIKRAAIVSTLPLIKKKDIGLAMKLVELYINNEEDYIQKATGWIIRECGKEKPQIIRKFILKHLDMRVLCFSYATEQMIDLRKERQKIKDKKGILVFGKELKSQEYFSGLIFVS
jgi:3-methyladenine DNA glycosylase AlkD